MSPRSTKGECRGCGAEMLWGLTEKGKGVPLDPDPVADGNLVIDQEATDGRPIMRYIRKGEVIPEGTPRYKSHFATCTDAESFKR